MSSVITLAFENWKAQEAATGKAVELNEFVFANVPNLDETQPIDRNESLPEKKYIVHRQAVNKTGLVSENAVAYSVTLGTDVGDFDFNWIGLLNKASGTVAMITHVPVQKKIKTKDGQQGNVLTRSFLLEFNAAAEETQIQTSAETWQIDFTARLFGIDEFQRLINLDTYGLAAFFDDGFLVTKENEKFTVNKGLAYISGLRGELKRNQTFNGLKNTKIYADFSYQGNLVSQWEAKVKLTVAENLTDYTDNAGFNHFVAAIAEIDSEENIKDLRTRKPTDGEIEEIKNKLETKVDNEQLSQELGSDEKKVMSQAAVTAAISESFVNIPDATTEVKGKVKLTKSLGESESLVLHQKAITKIFEPINTSVNKVDTLIPSSLVSATNYKLAVEIIESNPLLGQGEINTYRKTKHGWWVRERIVTGGYSGGESLPDNNCPVWRLGQLFICPHLLTLKKTLTNSSGDIGSYEIIPDQFKNGDNKNNIQFYQMKGDIGQYIEFITDTKNSDINILFAATANTARTMTVEFYDDSLLIDSVPIKTVGKGGIYEFNTYVTSVKNPRPGSKLTVRITKADAYYAYIAGINANFDTCISDDIDKIYWSLFNKTKLIRPTQTGAMCYVFRELESNLFGGESHGGETPSLQQFIVDNNDRILKSGEMFSCESFRVVQETQIKWSETTKIDCFTEHRFNSDGTHEFTGSFVPTENFKASLAYCPMFTINYDYFKKIRTPEYCDLINYPEGSFIEFKYPINSFEMQSSDNLYTSGIIWSVSLKNTDVSNVLIKPYSDRSTKLYAGSATNKTVTLEPFSIHQYRYYF